MPTKDPLICFKSTDEQREKLKAFAKDMGVPSSEICRDAVEFYMNLDSSMRKRVRDCKKGFNLFGTNRSSAFYLNQLLTAIAAYDIALDEVAQEMKDKAQNPEDTRHPLQRALQVVFIRDVSSSKFFNEMDCLQGDEQLEAAKNEWKRVLRFYEVFEAIADCVLDEKLLEITEGITHSGRDLQEALEAIVSRRALSALEPKRERKPKDDE